MYELIKAGERIKRGESTALETNIQSPSTLIPRQWSKYMANPHNKVNLCEYLSETWCSLGQEKLLAGQQIVLGGGFRDGQKAVIVMKINCQQLVALKSDHEEADTRIILHAKDAFQHYHNATICSPDADVLIIAA